MLVEYRKLWSFIFYDSEGLHKNIYRLLQKHFPNYYSKTFYFLAVRRIPRTLNYQGNTPSLTWIFEALLSSSEKSNLANDNDNLDLYVLTGVPYD